MPQISNGHFHGLSKVPGLLFIASKWRFYQKRQNAMVGFPGIFLLSSFTDFNHSLANRLTQRCVHIQWEASQRKQRCCWKGIPKEKAWKKKISHNSLSESLPHMVPVQSTRQSDYINQFFYIFCFIFNTFLLRLKTHLNIFCPFSDKKKWNVNLQTWTGFYKNEDSPYMFESINKLLMYKGSWFWDVMKQ